MSDAWSTETITIEQFVDPFKAFEALVGLALKSKGFGPEPMEYRSDAVVVPFHIGETHAYGCVTASGREIRMNNRPLSMEKLVSVRVAHAIAIADDTA